MSATILSFPDGSKIEGDARIKFDEDYAEALLKGEGSFDPIQSVDPEQVKIILDKIDQLRSLVEQGRIDGLVFVGQDPVTGYFITELCLEPDLNRTELFGYMGVLETVKLELSEQAAMAPVMTLAGVILDPYDYEEEQ